MNFLLAWTHILFCIGTEEILPLNKKFKRNRSEYEIIIDTIRIQLVISIVPTFLVYRKDSPDTWLYDVVRLH